MLFFGLSKKLKLSQNTDLREYLFVIFTDNISAIPLMYVVFILVFFTILRKFR